MTTIANEIVRIIMFVWGALIHIWPLLLISIPLSVLIKELNVSKVIGRVFSKNIWVSIVLATLLGAVAPFCSCSVIPVISALLTAGVPIAPVMSFWLASPSMDPEIFFLSVGSLGWTLAITRIVATFFMSIAGGVIIQMMYGSTDPSEFLMINRRTKSKVKAVADTGSMFVFSNSSSNCSCSTDKVEVCCEDTLDSVCCESAAYDDKEMSNRAKHIISSIVSSTWFVVKFLIIAYVLEALIKFYIPIEFVTGFFGDNPFVSVIKATLVGIPLYTTNLTSLGLVAGLLSKGLSGGAGLAFLIGGATTTIPAMAAVYKLVDRRIFTVYLGVAIMFSMVFGWMYNIIGLIL